MNNDQKLLPSWGAQASLQPGLCQVVQGLAEVREQARQLHGFPGNLTGRTEPGPSQEEPRHEDVFTWVDSIEGIVSKG